MAQREAVLGLVMGEAGGIEIKAEPLLPRPGDPALEVARLQLIEIHSLLRIGIDGMEIDLVLAWDQGERFLQIGAHSSGVRAAPGSCL